MTELIVTIWILSLVPVVAEFCETIAMNQFEMDALIIGESISPLLATMGVQIVAIDGDEARLNTFRQKQWAECLLTWHQKKLSEITK